MCTAGVPVTTVRYDGIVDPLRGTREAIAQATADPRESLAKRARIGFRLRSERGDRADGGPLSGQVATGGVQRPQAAQGVLGALLDHEVAAVGRLAGRRLGFGHWLGLGEEPPVPVRQGEPVVRRAPTPRWSGRRS
jgi:hypothetical protein